MNKQAYPDHDLDGLLQNEDFQRWALKGDDAAYWVQWQEQHPARAPLVQEAAELLRNIRFTTHRLPANEHAALWERIAATNAAPPLTRRLWHRRLPARAAVWTGLLLLGALAALLLTRPAQTAVASGYGEIKTITLPDGSSVTLNANSRLRFAPDWQAGKTREVWLEGEAFFSVQPLSNATFHVYTRHVEITVLGTAFNVQDRRSKTEVVLTSGKVRLHGRGGAGTLVLTPGRKATFLRQQLTESAADTVRYTGWRHHQVILSETTVQEIADMIEDQYGVKVVIRNPALARRRLDGRFTAHTLHDVLFMLEQVLGMQIEQQDKEILFY